MSLSDINDETPAWASAPYSEDVDEAENSGTVVATHTATDADAGDTITYSLTGNWSFQEFSKKKCSLKFLYKGKIATDWCGKVDSEELWSNSKYKSYVMIRN